MFGNLILATIKKAVSLNIFAGNRNPTLTKIGVVSFHATFIHNLLYLLDVHAKLNFMTSYLLDGYVLKILAMLELF